MGYLQVIVDDDVYHYPHKEHSVEHPNGYDVCLSCVDKIQQQSDGHISLYDLVRQYIQQIAC